MVEVTINIKTTKHYIKLCKYTNGRDSGIVRLPKELIGLDVLCIPLISPDMIIVNESNDEDYLINCCGYEMLHKTVKPHNNRSVVRGGYVLVSGDYVNDDVLIIPL